MVALGCSRTALSDGESDTEADAEAEGAVDTAITEVTDSAEETIVLPEAVPVQLALGTQHGCAVVTGGVRCWGYNGNGQLGDGSTLERHVAVEVRGADEFVDIAAGGNTTCARTRDGRVSCWGDGGLGQRGDGDATARATEPRAVLIDRVRQIAVGATHTCAARFDGTLWCWGDAAHGALGREGTATCGDHRCETRPRQVPELDRVVRVSLGRSQTCAIRDDDSVWCWGKNDFGQLGDGTTFDRSDPRSLVGVRAVDVGLGTAHVCALVRGGLVSCWGSNQFGKLGFGIAPTGDGCLHTGFAPQYSTEPHTVPGLGEISRIAVGANHTCAIRLDGAASCWGMNWRGELGDGFSYTTAGEMCSEKPQIVIGLDPSPTAIAAGNAFSCAMTSARHFCWGMNMFGQLGDGTTDDRVHATVSKW